MSIRVLVADDQDRVRRGLARLIDAQPNMAVVGEAADGARAVSLARSLRPDVALVDIRMPRLDGLDVTRLLAAPDADPQVRVVIVTTFDADEYVHAALRAGACGFVLKRSGPALLAEAVRAAMAGESLISPAITVKLLRHLAPEAHRPPPNPLTPRETELARLVARGLSNADIAAELFISVGTVKTHLASIQAKLNAANRVGIAAWCWQTGRADPVA
ncbi:response regulator transcription factor [Glycomyces sp. NPDC047010]|uniref:response regulator transcription factor n=1 Tax=Glycomyces sp. NPDC047010 TaxID=3155023 RepID=UPI0033DA213D